MFKQIVIKPSQRIISALLMTLLLVACGQKAPLQPAPLPEQNQPENVAPAPGGEQ